MKYKIKELPNYDGKPYYVIELETTEMFFFKRWQRIQQGYMDHKFKTPKEAQDFIRSFRTEELVVDEGDVNLTEDQAKYVINPNRI